MIEIESLSAKELLQLYGKLLETLKSKGITRSSNNPVADYAEKLVSDGLGLKLATKSNTGFDAVDKSTGERYEVKSRRLTRHNKSRQLGALRNLEKNPFDFLVGVIFNEDFSVAYAALMPLQAAIDHSTFTEHTRSHKLILRESIFEDPRVKNVTPRIAA